MNSGVWILGSCVTRDALAEDTEGFELVEYWARTSLASAFSATPVGSVQLSNIASSFQRRMVEGDVKKLIPSQLTAAKAELYVVDLIDERFDLCQTPDGGLCTVSNELRSSGFTRDAGRIITSGSAEFFTLWERGWSALLATLREKGALDKLRIHKAYWSTNNEDRSGFLPSYPASSILAANDFLDRLYARVAQDVPREHIIECPADLVVGALQHKWGLSPFHYVTPYYREFMRRLRESQRSARSASARVEFSAPKGGPRELRDVALSAEPVWLDLRGLGGSKVVVNAKLQGGSGLGERRALVTVDFGTDQYVDAAELGLASSHDPRVGAYRYLTTGPGARETSFTLTLPPFCDRARLGVRSWWPDDWLQLETLSVNEPARPTSATLLSVDVEALPSRSAGNQVEELIFGNIAGERGRGIARICDIFSDFGVRATFFVDYATTAVYGDAGIFRASEYIRERGHDVQLHMHSEELIRKLKWHPTAAFFGELDIALASRVLEYGSRKFEENLGYRPTIFRPGGLNKCKAMYEAAHQVGFKAVSAVFRGYDTERWSAFGHDCVVDWANGLQEIPLDLALDPLGAWEPFARKSQAFRSERPSKSLSLLIHSTSLLIRERSPEAVFTHYHAPYDVQLIRYLEMLTGENTRFISHSDALDEASHTSPIIPLEWADRAAAVPEVSAKPVEAAAKPIEAAPQQPAPPAPAVAPAPQAQQPAAVAAPAQQQAEAANANGVDSPAVHIPPTVDDFAAAEACCTPAALPLRLARGQSLHTVEYRRGAGTGALPYIVTGHKAYILRQRGSLPTGDELRELVQTVFHRHPMVSKIIAEWVLNDFSEFPDVTPTFAKQTFVLDLPESFETYRLEHISRELRRDIEREERRANEELSGMSFDVVEGLGVLTREVFEEATQLIEAHLLRKDPNSEWRSATVMKDYEVFASHGFIARLMSGGRPIAAALCQRFGADECYLSSTAHDERLTKQSLGKISLYRLIEFLIGQGVRTFHLGGGDFGYKKRFGATERPLNSAEILRTDALSPVERVELALQAGAKPCRLEKEINNSLEEVLGDRFETTLGVDFDAILENQEIGTGPESRRYQATITQAFVTLLEATSPTVDDVFVDVGSGKGKMLYYAAQLGFEKCIGIELSSALVPLAERNLRRMALSASVELLQRDASKLSPADVSAGTVFYLYNPFSEEVLSKFLASVVSSQALRRRPIKIVYCNARCEDPFRQHGFSLYREFKRGVAGWRYDDSAIYELH